MVNVLGEPLAVGGVARLAQLVRLHHLCPFDRQVGPL